MNMTVVVDYRNIDPLLEVVQFPPNQILYPVLLEDMIVHYLWGDYMEFSRFQAARNTVPLPAIVKFMQRNPEKAFVASLGAVSDQYVLAARPMPNGKLGITRESPRYYNRSYISTYVLQQHAAVPFPTDLKGNFSVRRFPEICQQLALGAEDRETVLETLGRNKYPVFFFQKVAEIEAEKKLSPDGRKYCTQQIESGKPALWVETYEGYEPSAAAILLGYQPSSLENGHYDAHGNYRGKNGGSSKTPSH